MKKYILTLLVIAAVAASNLAADLTATIYSRLQWEDSNAPGATAGYNLRFTGTTNSIVFVPALNVVTNQVNLTNIFRAYENGQFKVTVTAVSQSGIESEESLPLFYFWYGHILPVTNLVHTFNRIQ